MSDLNPEGFRPGVVVAFMFNETVSGWFCHSMNDMLRWDGQGSGYTSDANGGGLIMISTGPRIAEARNRIIDEFASQYERAEWLLMLDADMTFPATLLDQMMAVATPEETPILGGLCFTGGRDHAPKPTIYRQLVVDGGFSAVETIEDYPRDALVKVGATGAACMLLHRQALAKMQDRYRTLENGQANPYPWFAEGVIGRHGDAWGEDILFCLRAGAIGIPVHVLTTVKLGHVKPSVIDETYYDNWRREADLDRLAKVATGEVPAVIEAGEVVPAHDPVPEYGPNRAERRRRAREKVVT